MTSILHRFKQLFLGKFSKFSINGAINYPLKLGLVYIFTELFHVWYFISYIITLALVITFSFFFNVYITFKATANKKKILVKYLAALTVFACLDAMLVRLLTEVLGIYYLLSINFVMIGLFILKFFFYKNYVFVAKTRE